MTDTSALPPRRRPAIDALPRDGNRPRYELPAPLAPEAERLHRRQRLAAAIRRAGGEAGARSLGVVSGRGSGGLVVALA